MRMGEKSYVESEETISADRSRNYESLNFLLHHLFKYKIALFGALLAVLLASGTVLALGQGVKYLVDKGFAGGDSRLLDRGVTLLLGVSLIMALASYARFYLASWLGERIVADIRSRVFHHIVRLTPSYFEEARVGDVLSRLTTDTTLIQVMISTSVPIAARNFFMLVGSFILLCTTSLRLTGFVLLVIPLIVVPILFYGRQVRQRSRIAQEKVSDATSFAHETLNGLQTIQSFCHETLDANVYHRQLESAFQAARQHIKLRATMTAVVISLVFSAISVVLWAGGHAVIKGQMTYGDLSSFVFYAMIAAGSIGAISEMIADIQRASGASERLENLLFMMPEISDPSVVVPLKPRYGMPILILENVYFSFPSRLDREVLHDISFSILPGETVAIVGPSGAGKSTLFDLILRFREPDRGQIYLHGTPIEHVDFKTLRTRIRTVHQTPVLFNRTVEANVRYGHPEATREEVTRALEIAAAKNFVEELPQKAKTLLGERGVRLSGGQRQRIAIARAVVGLPEILLLDEATSALDTISEKAVQQAIYTLLEKHTVLVIAHRLSTVQRANRIVVMDQGRIIDVGTHQELLARCPLYERLAEADLQVDAP